MKRPARLKTRSISLFSPKPLSITAAIISFLGILGVLLGTQRFLSQEQYSYLSEVRAAGPTGSSGAIATQAQFQLPNISPSLAPRVVQKSTSKTTLTNTNTAKSAIEAKSLMVAITHPKYRSLVDQGSTVTITATAADDSGVNRMVFSINGTQVCVDLTTPYTCNWNVPKSYNRSFSLTATGYDAYDNVSTATSIVTTQ